MDKQSIMTMVADQPKLNSCPFCGSNDIYVYIYILSNGWAECYDCGARIGVVDRNEMPLKEFHQRIANKWNNRSKSAPPKEGE